MRFPEAGAGDHAPTGAVDAVSRAQARAGTVRRLEVRAGADTSEEAARPDPEIGACGEHGADPDPVHFFPAVGLDHVSCSPFRVPAARPKAGWRGPL